MPEPYSAERAAQLKARLDRDSNSRVFLQLAEEYRRAGRLDEAVRVLDDGLKTHPVYIAARVVLGRTLLESGQAERSVRELEHAVELDPTQLVANRLLVEAHLEMGEPRKARERLELYRLLNDRDVEIERLDERILELGGPPAAGAARRRPQHVASTTAARFAPDPPPDQPHPPSHLEDAAVASRQALMEPLGAMASGSVASARALTIVRSEQPFGPIRFSEAGLRTSGQPDGETIFAVRPFRSAALAPPVAARATRQEAEVESAFWSPDREPQVESEESQLPTGTEEIERVEENEEGAEVEGSATSEVFEELEELAEFEEVEPVATESLAARQDVPALSSTASTATLGELYLSQGHLADAEESFAAVLETKPGDAAALAGIAEVRRRREEAEEAFLDDAPARLGAPVAEVRGPGGLTSRKVFALRDFLARMKRGSSSHVS